MYFWMIDPDARYPKLVSAPSVAVPSVARVWI